MMNTCSYDKSSHIVAGELVGLQNDPSIHNFTVSWHKEWSFLIIFIDQTTHPKIHTDQTRPCTCTYQSDLIMMCNTPTAVYYVYDVTVKQLTIQLNFEQSLQYIYIDQKKELPERRIGEKLKQNRQSYSKFSSLFYSKFLSS